MRVFNEEKEADAAELTRMPRSLLRPSKYISCLKNKSTPAKARHCRYVSDQIPVLQILPWICFLRLLH